MTQLDHLRLRARNYWFAQQALPTSLFNEMVKAGLDVDAEQSLFESIEGVAVNG